MTEDLLPQTPEEQAYFDSKGEADAPVEQPVAEPVKDAPAEPDKAPDKPADEPLDPAEEHPQIAKMVPLPALQEERKLRRQEREERLKLQGRMEMLERMANEGRAQQQPEVKELDPLAKLEESHQFVAEQRKREQQSAARSDLVDWYASDAAEFSQENPDFTEAYKYAVDHRLKELHLVGLTPAEARQTLEQNELVIVHMARQRGISAAQIIYDQAKHRGYTGKKAEEPKAAPDKLANVAEGQKAAKSLSQAPGGTAKVKSIEALLSMDDDEFDAATKGKKWRQIFEG